MSRARRQPLEAYTTIGELITAVLNSVTAFCNAEYVHVLLDSYIEFSLKEPERVRRSDAEEGIDVVGLSENSQTPQQKDLFWASENNKRNLQMLLRNIDLHRQNTLYLILFFLGVYVPLSSHSDEQTNTQTCNELISKLACSFICLVTVRANYIVL